MCSSDTIPLFAIAVGGTPAYAYTWDNGVGNQTQDVHPATPTSYNVFATDAHGCVSPTVTTNLTMLQALAFNVTGDTSICAGSSLLLSASSVNGYPTYSYLWSTGPNDTLNSVTVTPTAPTVYTISVTDRCVTVDSVINIGFYAIPQLTVTADNANGCSPLTVHFAPNIPANLLGNCLWEFSNGQTSTSCSDIIATFTDPGCYDATYTGTTADGCPLTGSFQSVACVYPDPVANFTYNPTNPTVLTTEVHFTDHSAGAVSYHWTFSGYGSSTEQNPLHTFNGIEPNDVITACLEVVSIGGCIDSVCHEITFTDEFVIYVPNAFTPDGDAYNNIFLPVLPAGTIVDNYNLTIFDRWGEIIFESLNYEAGWDGTYHDKLVQDGVYTWTIQLHEGFKHTTKKFVGHVSVLR
jgi:gliding motility-associated-like protein